MAPPALPPPARPPCSRVAAELAALAQRLDIIPPEEIQVLRLLGSGSYGEVYLAKWNESDVAVKCLNARYRGKKRGKQGNDRETRGWLQQW